MLLKLIVPVLENGFHFGKLISYRNISISNILFEKSSSQTNSNNSSSKNNNKSLNSNSKENQNKNRAQSDVEQELSQHEGPADKQAEQKSSKKN